MRRTFPAHFVATLAGLVTPFALCRPALAQETADEDITVAARALFNEGRELAQHGQCPEAADRFRRVLSLRASHAVRYNLAGAYVCQSKLVDAADLLRVIVRDAPAREPARRAAEDLLRAVERRLGHITVRLTGEVVGAHVSIDEHVLPPADVGTSTSVDPGRHVVAVRRAGAEETREAQVSEGGSIVVELRVPAPPQTAQAVPAVVAPPIAAPIAQPQPFAPEPAPARSRGVTTKWWFWTAIGAVVIGGTVTAVAVASGGGAPSLVRGTAGLWEVP